MTRPLTLEDSYHDHYLTTIGKRDYKIDDCSRVLLVGIGNVERVRAYVERHPDKQFGIIDLREPPSKLPSNVTYHQALFEEADIPMYDVAILHGVYSWISKEAVEGLKKNVFPRISKRLYLDILHRHSMIFTYRDVFQRLYKKMGCHKSAAAKTVDILGRHSPKMALRFTDATKAHYFYQPDLIAYDPVELIKEFQEYDWSYHTRDMDEIIGFYGLPRNQLCFNRTGKNQE